MLKNADQITFVVFEMYFPSLTSWAHLSQPCLFPPFIFSLEPKKHLSVTPDNPETLKPLS